MWDPPSAQTICMYLHNSMRAAHYRPLFSVYAYPNPYPVSSAHAPYSATAGCKTKDLPFITAKGRSSSVKSHPCGYQGAAKTITSDLKL